MAVLIFLFVLLLVVLIFSGLWAWTIYLDEAKPAGVRFILYLAFIFIGLIEYSIWHLDLTKPWLIIPVLICDIWGMYDAVARYPVVHDIDSFFTLKEVVLLAAKTLAYAMGFRNIGRMAGWFLLCLFTNVWFLPLLYLMALPIGDSQMQHAKTDVIDQDLVIRLINLRRRDCREPYLRWVHRSAEGLLIYFGKSVPFMRTKLEKNPRYRRLMRGSPQV